MSRQQRNRYAPESLGVTGLGHRPLGLAGPNDNDNKQQQTQQTLRAMLSRHLPDVSAAPPHDLRTPGDLFGPQDPSPELRVSPGVFLGGGGGGGPEGTTEADERSQRRRRPPRAMNSGGSSPEFYPASSEHASSLFFRALDRSFGGSSDPPSLAAADRGAGRGPPGASSGLLQPPIKIDADAAPFPPEGVLRRQESLPTSAFSSDCTVTLSSAEHLAELLADASPPPSDEESGGDGTHAWGPDSLNLLLSGDTDAELLGDVAATSDILQTIQADSSSLCVPWTRRPPPTAGLVAEAVSQSVAQACDLKELLELHNIGSHATPSCVETLRQLRTQLRTTTTSQAAAAAAAAQEKASALAGGGDAESRKRKAIQLSMLAAQARELFSKPTGSVVCQVPSCGKALTAESQYSKRYRLCRDCMGSRSVVVDGKEQRFCQQCSFMHSISDFDASKKSCRAKLQEHAKRMRRVRANKASANAGGGVRK